MAPGFPITMLGQLIRTSEALYQACRLPHRPDIQRIVIDETSPMTAKMKSKPYRKDSRPDWEDIRVQVMRWCLRVKLAQNWETFSALLLATGDRPIVEDSRKDVYWGAKAAERRSSCGPECPGQTFDGATRGLGQRPGSDRRGATARHPAFRAPRSANSDLKAHGPQGA
ncbi:NADAR family protein [Mesorhizobium sp. M1169]|uniref:NADAR family protein n=1 Tax=Mesorhizobium sp. M1169 TaxID=2957066 RepID=UPI0033352AC6